jgi:hypothetical protein
MTQEEVERLLGPAFHTPAGRAFLVHAHRALSSLEQMPDDTSEAMFGLLKMARDEVAQKQTATPYRMVLQRLAVKVEESGSMKW